VELKKRQKISPAKKAKIGGVRWVARTFCHVFLYEAESFVRVCVCVPKSAQKFLNLIKLEAISGKANKSWPKTAAAVRESRRKFG